MTVEHFFGCCIAVPLYVCNLKYIVFLYLAGSTVAVDETHAEYVASVCGLATCPKPFVVLRLDIIYHNIRALEMATRHGFAFE